MQTPAVVQTVGRAVERGRAWPRLSVVRARAMRLAPGVVMLALLLTGYLWHAAGTLHVAE